MKKKFFFLWLCICLCSFSACRININGGGNTLKGSGNIITEERQVPSFQSIQASRGVNVFIESGKSDCLKVSSDDNLIGYIRTEVSGETLSVTLMDGVNVRNQGKLDVYVKMEQISKLVATSGADITGTSCFTLKNIDMEATSAGDISLELEAEHIRFSITSGADIILKGKAGILQGSVTSGADLMAAGLNVRSCDISLTSGADALVNVAETIAYSVTSGADLKCKGHPRTVKSHVSSGGDVIFN